MVNGGRDDRHLLTTGLCTDSLQITIQNNTDLKPPFFLASACQWLLLPDPDVFWHKGCLHSHSLKSQQHLIVSTACFPAQPNIADGDNHLARQILRHCRCIWRRSNCVPSPLTCVIAPSIWSQEPKFKQGDIFQVYLSIIYPERIFGCQCKKNMPISPGYAPIYFIHKGGGGETQELRKELKGSLRSVHYYKHLNKMIFKDHYLLFLIWDPLDRHQRTHIFTQLV